MGIQLIGSGTCLIENTHVKGRQFADLRADYGATWEGDLIIKNCEFTPHKMRARATVLGAYYTGLHDFGYPCYMPRKILIDGLTVHDEKAEEGYPGPRILSAIHANYMDEAFVEKFPYSLPEEIEVRNLTTKSGKPWELSDNKYLFRNVKVTGLYNF
jgi:hypothetical protein